MVSPSSIRHHRLSHSIGLIQIEESCSIVTKLHKLCYVTKDPWSWVNSFSLWNCTMTSAKKSAPVWQWWYSALTPPPQKNKKNMFWPLNRWLHYRKVHVSKTVLYRNAAQMWYTTVACIISWTKIDISLAIYLSLFISSLPLSCYTAGVCLHWPSKGLCV